MKKIINLKQGFLIGILTAIILAGIELTNISIMIFMGADIDIYSLLAKGITIFLLYLILMSYIIFFPETTNYKSGYFNKFKDKIILIWIGLYLILVSMFIIWAFRTGELQWPV